MIEFPKEILSLNRIINDAIDCDDYDVIYKNKDLINDSFEYFKNTDIYVYLVKSYFYKEKYESVIMLVTELLRKEYERLECYYFLILSCLAVEDVYQGASIVKKSRLLNSPEIVIYWNDEATYSSLINCDDDLKKAGLMVQFLMELVKEITFGAPKEDGYIGLRYFELVNTLLEIGFSEEFIKELINIANVIFVN